MMERRQKEMKRCTLCASALALILILTATAAAAPTQNWGDFLADWGIDPKSPQTAAHTKIIGQTEEALGVSLSVEGLYYDGETFLLGFRTENLQPESPALVLYTKVIIVDTEAHNVSAAADHPLSKWYPRIFELSPADDPVNNLMSDFRADMDWFSWNGEVEISAYFTVVKPTKPLVIVDAEIYNAYDNADMEKDRQAMLANLRAHGVTIAEADDIDVDAWREKGYIVVNRLGQTDLLGDYPGREYKLFEFIEIDPSDSEKQEVVITFQVNLDELAEQ
jgi:uncharacterized membrane protein